MMQLCLGPAAGVGDLMTKHSLVQPGTICMALCQLLSQQLQHSLTALASQASQ